MMFFLHLGYGIVDLFGHCYVLSTWYGVFLAFRLQCYSIAKLFTDSVGVLMRHALRAARYALL